MEENLQEISLFHLRVLIRRLFIEVADLMHRIRCLLVQCWGILAIRFY